MLPEFADARALPTPPGFGTRFRLAEEVGQVGSGKGGNGLAVALETQAGFQFIGHQLKVRRLLKGQKMLEKAHGFRRPVWPMVAT